MPFSEVRGQDDAVRQLRASFARGRLGHAILLSGPEGVGKRLVARQLAQALLCENPPHARGGELDNCGRCPACVQVMAGTHPQYHRATTPEDRQELPVAVVRAFCDQLRLKPARAAHTVGVVEDADELNEEAANSFLKTLEEPPPGAVLVLIASDPMRQLPTIRSRCQSVALRPLSGADVESILSDYGFADDAERAELARLARGSPGLAIRLAAGSLRDFRRDLLAALSAPRVNPVALAALMLAHAESAGKESAPQRDEARAGLTLAASFYREVLRAALDAEAGQGGTSGPESAVAGRVGSAGALASIEALQRAQVLVNRRTQLALVFEQLAGSLAAPAGGAA